MLSPRNFECGISGDQPNSVGVSGTNSDTATEADESDVGDEISSEEDSMYGCDSCDGWDEEDGNDSSESEVWESNGEREHEECPPGFWDDDDDDNVFDKNSEDEDSDQRSSEQDASKAPLMKRAKTSHAVAASSSYSRNVRRKSLSLLPTMPFDILFEIFSHLSPTDIVNLSHISKVFHKTLSSRNAPAVWKAVRRRFSAPDGPDWMSDEAWVELLFGRNCQLCGKSNTSGCEVDFLLLKRVCVSCKERHCVSRSKVEKHYPDFDFVILLVPSTNRSPWNMRIAKCYYWKFDLDSMVSKLAALKQDADTQLLHCFMEERKRRLQCIRQTSSSWREWYIRMMVGRDQERRDDEGKRLVQIKDKFKELGYVEEDLGILYHQKEYLGPGKIQMTAKIWSRIRPLLEPAVKEQRARRLEKQRAITRQHGRWILSARYKEFQCTLHPSQWKYLPRTLEIAAFEGFSRHIEADVGVEVDGTAFDDAFLEFPTLLTAATEQRKKTLRALIVDSPIEFEDGEIGADPIDVATAVFRCIEVHNFPRPFKYVFGWDEIASHHCLPESTDNSCYAPESTLRKAPPELKYIPEIALVVRKLAQLIGLNAASATAADFDNIDKRFTCDACPFPKDKGQYSQIGYTWRNLAVHLETSKTHNPNLFITVLSDEEEEELKQRERNDGKWDANRWTCSHCSEYISNLQQRQSIVEHLSASHGIQEPSEPTDLLFFERCRSDWTTTRFVISATNPPKFRCLECVTKKDRQFTLNGVEAHLRAKHKIPSEQISLHYARA